MADTDRLWGRVLVVGGAGFVGSNLCRKLLAEDASEVIIVARQRVDLVEITPDGREAGPPVRRPESPRSW